VIAVDSNVLIYANREDAPLHDAAAEAVRELAESLAQWAIPWPCVHEFFGVVTRPGVFRQPSAPADAVRQIDAWLESPSLRLITDSHRHYATLRDLVVTADVRGPRVHDARIAAICLDHGVTELITMDRDFARFPALRTRSLLR
jgi:toxin-antitoxin system PIN domain toxin